MNTRPDFTLEALRAVIYAADEKISQGFERENLNQTCWLITAAQILADLAIEQKADAKQGGAE